MESNHECDTKTKFGDGFESDSEEFGANQCWAVLRLRAGKPPQAIPVASPFQSYSQSDYATWNFGIITLIQRIPFGERWDCSSVPVREIR